MEAERLMVIQPPLISTGTAVAIKRLRGRGFATKRLFHDDTYAAWTKDRPTTTGAKWDDATAGEPWIEVGIGIGRLYANGQGGPVISDDLVTIQAPYRFRTLTTAAFVPNVTHLVINGDRLFLVKAWEIEDTDDALSNAYLVELLDTDLPAVTP